MLAAHTDEIGFLVSHIDDNGFLRVQAIGGFDVTVLPAQRVMVWDRSGNPHRGAFMLSTKPAHLLDGTENTKAKTSDLFIDLGMVADDVSSTISVGDMVTMDRKLEVVGDSVMSKSLDDRVGVFVMIEAMRKAKDAKAEIHAVADHPGRSRVAGRAGGRFIPPILIFPSRSISRSPSIFPA